ncbi:MAG: tetratricopeptide repeat protein [Flavobacteriales bacterium]|nr:tetratricopeptide repeat protein [Flavobacteriales bacterium]
MTNNSHFDYGLQLLKSEHFEDALTAFTHAISIDNKNAKFYCERGVTYLHLKQFDKALNDMDRAVELEPDNPYRYASRAFIKGAAGDVNGGIKDYEKAVELDPEDAISYNNLGLLQERLGYQKQSKSSFTKADNISENNPDFANMFGAKNNEHGNSNVLDTSKNPKVNLAGANNLSKKETYWSVLKSVFTSKQMLVEFLNFVKSGFKTKKK